MNELISVIIPIYNAEGYLSECLDSVINQTYKSLEIICVNDCSTDKSLKILEEYAKKDNRIIVHNQEQTGGASYARNIGIDISTGNYIYFIDSDDWIDSDYLEKMVSAIEKMGCDVVANKNILTEFPDFSQSYKHPSEKDIPVNSYIDTNSNVQNMVWAVWNKIYKSSFIKNNNIKFPVGYIVEDIFFHYATFAATDKLYYIAGPYYHYRHRVDSISTTQDDVGVNNIKVLSLIYDYFAENNLLEKNMKIYSTFSWYCIKNKQIYDEYKKYFCKVIKYLNSHKEIYNEMDLYFANNVVNSTDYDDYVSKYPQSAVLSYIRRKKCLSK